MRVLHVLPSLDQMYGGPLRAVIDLSSHSRQFGLESEILGLGTFDVRDTGLPRSAFHDLPLSFPALYRYSRSLRPWLAENLRRFDGVVIHGSWLYPNWATYQACREVGVKYAYFPHGMLDPWAVAGQGLFKRLKKSAYWYARERRVLLESECVFFTTERERSASGTTFSALNEQRIVIPYGIEAASRRIDNPARPELAIHPGTKAALFLGRVHPKKNAPFLLKAWMNAKIPNDWRLIIAGPVEASYLRDLTAITDSHARGKTVTFVGPVSGVDKLYLLQNCSWFLLPSKQENFGVAVLEAISNGCPAVISDEVYLADELHGESEILKLEEEQWTQFFEKRMVDEQWRRHLRDLDKMFVLPNFAIENVARSWARTLAEVFGTKQ